MSIQAIDNESSKSAFQTFMVVMVKGKMGVVHPIQSLLDQSGKFCNMKQVLLYSSDGKQIINSCRYSYSYILYWCCRQMM